MVLHEDNDGNWLADKTENSSDRPIAEQTVSNLNSSLRKSVFSYMAKKPTSKMLTEAIKILSNDTRGASVPAITKWISGNYAVSDLEKLKLQIKKAVIKALKTGTIVRSEKSKASLGSSGSFVLGKENEKKSRKKTEKWSKQIHLKQVS